MDSKEGITVSNTKTAEGQATTSSNIIPSEGNYAEKDLKFLKTSEKAITEGNSPANAAEPSDPVIRDKLEAEVSADSLSNTVSVEGEEVLRQSRDTEVSLGRSASCVSSENFRDHSSERKQAPTCDVGTQSSNSPVETARAREKEQIKAKQSAASTQTLPLAYLVQTKDPEGTGIEPNVASASCSSEFGGRTMDFNQEIDPLDRSQAASNSPGIKVYSLKTLANQKIVTLAEPDANRMSEIEVINVGQESNTEPSVLRTDSAGATCSGKEETERVDPEVTNARGTEDGNNYEDYERKAFFYISSSSVPDMDAGSELPSVSEDYQMNTERPICRAVRQETRVPRQCLGTQRCHYVVVAIALITAVIGCIVYHLSNSGIGPEVLRPIGASTAFLSFAVCVFSAVYINYLSNYSKLPIVPNYELLGDVESVMAMNRASNPELYYHEDGQRSAALEHYRRETQSADVLDRRGYVSLHSEVKRSSDESCTSYSTQPQKRLKTESAALVDVSDVTHASGSLRAPQSGISGQGDDVTRDEGTSDIPLRSMYVSAELPPDAQSSDECESETSPLLPHKDR